jgi:RNA polymerase sigma factor (sigma-70 family)
MKSWYQQLDEIELQDLYQASVVSLYRAIDSVKDGDPGERIQARIQSYAKEEIRRTYLGKKRQINPMDMDLIKELVLTTKPEFDQVDINDLYENIWALIDLGDVSRDDFNLLIEHEINGQTYTEIAKKHGIHYTTVSNRIKKLKDILRQKLE